MKQIEEESRQRKERKKERYEGTGVPRTCL
jgi:hypothetical protein